MKKQKGITLISLLVTVAVLTILVAVAISSVENDDIISETKKSASDFEVAQEKENLQRVVLGWSMEETDTLANHFKAEFGADKVQANADESITVEVESGNKYVVTEDGEVTLLDGTVEEPEPDTESEISISLDKTSITKEIESGSTATETLTATLTNATGTLTWTSSNTTVATVSGSGSTGTVTLKAAGSATITVSYGGVNATCSITVTEVESVSLIEFTIDGTTYNAEEGMTWKKWVDSKYNTGGYTVNDSGIFSGSKTVTFLAELVLPTDAIVSDGNYELSFERYLVEYLNKYRCSSLMSKKNYYKYISELN